MLRAGWVVWVILAIVPGAAAPAETLHFVTEDVAPVTMAGPARGEIRGIATELVEKALAESRIPYDVSLFSWARAYDMALNDHDTCVYSTSRTAERDPLFKWIGPIVRDRWVLFGRIDGPALTSLDQARGHSIGGHYDGASTRYLKSLGFEIDEVADFHSNMRRVAAHRLDFAVSGLLGGAYAIAHDTELADIVPVLSFKDVDLYVACNKSVSDKIVARLNVIVQRMSEDGTVAATIKHYQ
jgi:polar amino acid transport system substrate-binding protein